MFFVKYHWIYSQLWYTDEMNFYQSDLRKTINQEIYQKPSFELELLWNTYHWIVKSQRRLWRQLNRYMVHGVEWAEIDGSNTVLQEELTRVRRDFAKSSGDIFFQLWFLDPMWTGDTAELKKDEKLTTDLIQKKTTLNEHMTPLELYPSRREHMPDTTIRIPLSWGLDAMRSGYSKSGKRYINKAKKADLSYDVATAQEWKVFREIRYTMSYDKGFAIIDQESFIRLMEYLTSTQQWALHLAKKGKKIVSGSVVLHNDKDLIYLYGATDREHGAIWGHYRLTDQIMKRWSHHGYETYDLLWVAPPGQDDHYLSSVTRFKQAFGWETIVSVGNYDLVFNSLLYRAFQVVKTRRFG